MRRILSTALSLLILFMVIRMGANLLIPASTLAGTDELIILQETLPDHLDPAKNASFENALPLTGIYEGLVKLNSKTLKPEPSLAQSWSVSNDGRMWTFHLKPGIFFSDGSVCDAESIKTSMARSMVLKDSQPYCAFVFNPVSAIKTDGKYTLSFVLKYPYAPFIKNLALPFAAPVVSPKALSKYGDAFWKHPSGTGPYRLKEMDSSKIILEANASYHGDPPPTKKIIIEAIPDKRIRNSRLLNKQADLVFYPGQEASLQTSDIKRLSMPGIDSSYLGFYTDKAPFNNRILRTAVAGVLDRDKIVSTQMAGQGMSSAGLVPPPILSSEDSNPFTYTPEQVRRILHREGYPDGLDVTLMTYQDTKRYCPQGGTALAEEIKKQLKPAGIRVKIQSQPWNDHKKAMADKTGHFFLYGWTGDNGDADNFLYTLMASSQIGQGLNIFGYRNSELDVYLSTARRIQDDPSRHELYLRAGKIIQRDVPLTPINHSLIHVAYQPNVINVQLSGFGLIELDKVYQDQ